MGGRNILLTVARRLVDAIPSLCGVLVITFFLMRSLGGDPAVRLAGQFASAEAIARMRETLGLDKDIFTQFWIYLTGLAHGDFGFSYSTGRPVLEEIIRRLPVTLELSLLSFGLALTVGVALGTFAALRPDGWLDSIARLLATAGVAIPTFFLALLLIYVFYYRLGWAPAPFGQLGLADTPPPRVTGMLTVDCILAGRWQTLGAALAQLALPVVALSMSAMAPILRLTRAAMAQALGADYVRAARANGLKPWRVIWQYAFRNVLVTVITGSGIILSFMLGGSVVIESLFSWPGLGSFSADAVLTNDFAPVQGFMVTMAGLYMLLNLFIDIGCAIIDPRVSATGARR